MTFNIIHFNVFNMKIPHIDITGPSSLTSMYEMLLEWRVGQTIIWIKRFTIVSDNILDDRRKVHIFHRLSPCPSLDARGDFLWNLQRTNVWLCYLFDVQEHERRVCAEAQRNIRPFLVVRRNDRCLCAEGRQNTWPFLVARRDEECFWAEAWQSIRLVARGDDNWFWVEVRRNIRLVARGVFCYS